ncbi:transposase (fragment) [Thiomonas sp. CB3]|jgi:hypothetical protein
MIEVSLFAEAEGEAKLDKLGEALSKLTEHVDFAALAAEIDAAVPRPGRESGGPPPFPTEPMVRVLVIQQIYKSGDEQMEFQLLDRLSFQRFVGLRQSYQAPDRMTIWAFKGRLIKAGADEHIFDAVNHQLDRHGYIARGGQMIDASIVPVPRQTIRRDEKTFVQQDAMPAK